ncbi:MAG: hypothetical protein LBG06_11535 [Deltaproteobacteria bacterium]|jgi:hypothetical protein|nr:hypothetical protein [Deltaproteobacteria bacterium]
MPKTTPLRTPSRDRGAPAPLAPLLAVLAFALALAAPAALAQYQPGAPLQANPQPEGQGNALTSLDRAEAAHAIGDNVTAMLSIWDAMESVWNLMGEMGIRNAAFILEEPEFFGIYQPKPDENFMSGELIILYCEPFGYTMRREPNGTYTNSLRWSFKILDQEGNSMGGQNDIGPYTHGGYRTFTTEKMLALTINLSQFPAGSYTLSVTIIDDFNPSKSVEIQKPFNIIGDPQPPAQPQQQ